MTNSVPVAGSAQAERPTLVPLQARPVAPCGHLTMTLDGTILDANDTLAAWLGLGRPEELEAGNFADLLTAGSRFSYLSRHLPDLQRTSGLSGVLLELRRADRSTLPVLLRAVIDPRAGTPLVGVAVFDATERAAYEAELLQAKRKAETAAGKLSALHAVAAACARTADAAQIAQALVEVASDAFATYGCAVWLRQDELLRRVAVDAPDLSLTPETIACSAADAVAEVWRAGTVTVLRRTAPDLSPQLAAGMAAAGLDEQIGVALSFQDNVAGVLMLYLRRNDPSSDAEHAVLATLGAQVGQALERARLHAELERRAMHDALTGLPNRAMLLDRLGAALARADRTGEAIAVLLIDLNGFKAVNDRFGHAAGDDVLIEVAGRLRQAARTTDTIARLGGDEFVVVFESVDPAIAATLTRRVEQLLHLDVTIEGEQQHVSASIGTVVHTPARTTVDPAALLHEADEAMYEQKRSRSNR